MTLNKEMVIQTLEAALVNPNYLAKQGTENATNWFCSSVHQVLRENHSRDETDDIQQQICDLYIYPSINECLFLKSYLEQTELIAYGTQYNEQAYKITARNHWATLINNLKGVTQ